MDLINKLIELIKDEDPDIMTNWNGFGFDDNYIHERIIRLCSVINFMEHSDKENNSDDVNVTNLSKDQIKLANELFPVKLSRFDECSEFVSKKLASAALGDSTMRYYEMKGRVTFDLMKVVRRDYKLISYKLDYVASYIFRDKISKYEVINNQTVISVNTKDLHNDQYVVIIRNDGASDYECFDNKKFKVKLINDNSLVIDEVLNSLNYNFIVTHKEIDFQIDKLSQVIYNGINNIICSIKSVK